MGYDKLLQSIADEIGRCCQVFREEITEMEMVDRGLPALSYARYVDDVTEAKRYLEGEELDPGVFMKYAFIAEGYAIFSESLRNSVRQTASRLDVAVLVKLIMPKTVPNQDMVTTTLLDY
ncbi:hypothetical protein SPFM12_00167 [Salmonella phage SPFM12]|nr:hypothetical protein SPFM12_00167 [Salmonella phage SPFM12]